MKWMYFPRERTSGRPQVRTEKGLVVCHPNPGPSNEENWGRLIAAAPELLEACRLIKDKMFDDSIGGIAVQAAVRAFGKATGQPLGARWQENEVKV